MEYTEHQAAPHLQPYVKCIWILASDNIGTNVDFDKVLPDGCTELIFHLASPFEKKENGKTHTQEHSFVYGQLSSFVELRPVNNAYVVGVRFYPFGLAAFSVMPQYILAGQEIGIEHLFSSEKDTIHEQLSDASLKEEQVVLVNRFLSANLISERKGYVRDHFKSVAYAVKLLNQNDPERIAVIAKKLNISSREMERRFRTYIGVSPKQLSRTFRFQEVVKNRHKNSRLTDIVYLAGYYDQSHFIHDFKKFSGEKPVDFFASESSFSDFFITG